MMEVWLAESGEYEDRGVDGIYVSLDVAIACIKASYGPPYIVQWDEPTTDTDRETTLRGHFKAVRGYSVEHTYVATIRPMPLLASPTAVREPRENIDLKY